VPPRCFSNETPIQTLGKVPTAGGGIGSTSSGGQGTSSGQYVPP
jgi:hypothetical protein